MIWRAPNIDVYKRQLVAIMAGLIIFPACFAFGVEPGSGPGLVFITLPSVFSQMPVGQLWGTLFFLFMSFAALSTVVAVFENIMSFSMDEWGWSRNRACLVNGIALALLSLPCVLGFNVWAGVEVPGIGNIQAIEDFLMSNNVLPLGALVFLLFCTSKRGWGCLLYISIMVDFPAFPSWERAIFTEFTERLLLGSRPLAYDLREIALSGFRWRWAWR